MILLAAATGLFLTLLTVLPFMAFLVGGTAYLLIGARHSRAPGLVGDALTKPVQLRIDERVDHTIGAIRRLSPWIYISGWVYLTNERLLFSPRRSLMNDTGEPFGLEYDRIERWYVVQRWAFGIGHPPMTRQAVVVECRDGQNDEVFWPAWGYDLVGMFRRSVPREGEPVAPRER